MKLPVGAIRVPSEAIVVVPALSIVEPLLESVTVVGFDYHQPSIEVARKRATEAGIADRVSFEVATAQDFPGDRYDLVCIFDALHDMGDPPAAARYIRSKLDDDEPGSSWSRWRGTAWRPT